mmetsp:Transcript_84533/g.217763  ORF Transcript_84533/g.217763 Transcript_84533/m.217763 type:complete len:216 (-) Transcript_84533:418-1065(-)
MASWSLKSVDWASCPIARNAPVKLKVSVTVWSLGCSSTAPVRPEASCIHLWTCLKVFTVIFGSCSTRSSISADARKSSRRWTSVTLLAKRARKRASSSAVSPPPTTATSSSMYRAPSHTAHVEMPLPFTACSSGAFSHRAVAPVAMMIESASITPSSPPSWHRKGRVERSTFSTSFSRISAPKRSACLRRSDIISGPETASGYPGKFSMSEVSIS